MAGTVNKVILIGRLGADPDMRYSADGSAVARFSMATDEPVRGPDGNWEERPEWHRIVAFGRLAEISGDYLSKGKSVYVEGKLRTRQWEDQQGTKRYNTEIVAKEIQFLGDGQARDGREGGQASQAGHPGPSMTDELPPPPGDLRDEDIPF